MLRNDNSFFTIVMISKNAVYFLSKKNFPQYFYVNLICLSKGKIRTVKIILSLRYSLNKTLTKEQKIVYTPSLNINISKRRKLLIFPGTFPREMYVLI